MKTININAQKNTTIPAEQMTILKENEDIDKAYIAMIVKSRLIGDVSAEDKKTIISIYEDGWNDDDGNLDTYVNLINSYKNFHIFDHMSKLTYTSRLFRVTNDIMYDILAEIDNVASSDSEQTKYCTYAVSVIKAYLKTFVSIIREPYNEPIIDEFIDVIEARVDGFDDSAKWIPQKAVDCMIIDDCVKSGRILDNKGKINDDIIANVAEKHDASPEYVKALIKDCMNAAPQGYKPHYM